MCLSQGCEIQNAEIEGRIFSSAWIYLENGATHCAIVDGVVHVVLQPDTLISPSLFVCVSSRPVCLSLFLSLSHKYTNQGLL